MLSQILKRVLGPRRDGKAEDLKNLGNKFLAEGDLRQAEGLYRESIATDPRYAEAHNNLGAVLKQQGRFAEAQASFEIAIRANPKLANAYHNLGTVLCEQGDDDKAVACFRRALKLNPGFGEACWELANLHLKRQERESAREVILRGIAQKPEELLFHFFLGDRCREDERLEEALNSYRRVLAIDPRYAPAYVNLAIVLAKQDKLDEAIENYGKALVLQPDNAETHFNLGNALKSANKLDAAADSYRSAITLKPDFATAYYNLANTLQPQGRLDEAIAAYRKAIELKPDFTAAHCNLIFTLDLSPCESVASLQAERRRWDAAHAAGLMWQRKHPNDLDPQRRLRIGYVSGDIREHSALFVFCTMLANFDRESFEVFAYSNSRIEDTLTQVFRQTVTHWRNIVELTDADLAEQIWQDKIDILVDLSGFTSGNRLLVFARKPAPIQISAWGYATSTGMRAMDVFFADPVAVPPEERHFFTEEVRDLPCIVGYLRPQAFPPVNALPALSSEGITFGSFNRLGKISNAAFDAWTRILAAVPRSRLVIKTVELDAQVARDRTLAHFSEAGIAPERIVLLGKSPWWEHAAALNQVDIGLDPFPHCGGVSALESLMMGVPMVALRWPSMVGRVSASVLTALGLTDWIAETPEEYVETALRKAADLDALADLRERLRDVFLSSIVGDSEAYARAVEREYRKIWREWCARQREEGPGVATSASAIA